MAGRGAWRGALMAAGLTASSKGLPTLTLAPGSGLLYLGNRLGADILSLVTSVLKNAYASPASRQSCHGMTSRSNSNSCPSPCPVHSNSHTFLTSSNVSKIGSSFNPVDRVRDIRGSDCSSRGDGGAELNGSGSCSGAGGYRGGDESGNGSRTHSVADGGAAVAWPSAANATTGRLPTVGTAVNRAPCGNGSVHQIHSGSYTDCCEDGHGGYLPGSCRSGKYGGSRHRGSDGGNHCSSAGHGATLTMTWHKPSLQHGPVEGLSSLCHGGRMAWSGLRAPPLASCDAGFRGMCAAAGLEAAACPDMPCRPVWHPWPVDRPVGQPAYAQEQLSPAPSDGECSLQRTSEGAECRPDEGCSAHGQGALIGQSSEAPDAGVQAVVAEPSGVLPRPQSTALQEGGWLGAHSDSGGDATLGTNAAARLAPSQASAEQPHADLEAATSQPSLSVGAHSGVHLQPPATAAATAPLHPPTTAGTVRAYDAYLELTRLVLAAARPASLTGALRLAVQNPDLQGQHTFVFKLGALVLCRACELACVSERYGNGQGMHGVVALPRSAVALPRSMRGAGARSSDASGGKSSSWTSQRRRHNGSSSGGSSSSSSSSSSAGMQGRQGDVQPGQLQEWGQNEKGPAGAAWQAVAAEACILMERCTADARTAGAAAPVLSLRRCTDVAFWVVRAAKLCLLEAAGDRTHGRPLLAMNAGTTPRGPDSSLSSATTSSTTTQLLKGPVKCHAPEQMEHRSVQCATWAPAALLDSLIAPAVARELEMLAQPPLPADPERLIATAQAPAHIASALTADWGQSLPMRPPQQLPLTLQPSGVAGTPAAGLQDSVCVSPFLEPERLQRPVWAHTQNEQVHQTRPGPGSIGLKPVDSGSQPWDPGLLTPGYTPNSIPGISVGSTPSGSAADPHTRLLEELASSERAADSYWRGFEEGFRRGMAKAAKAGGVLLRAEAAAAAAAAEAEDGRKLLRHAVGAPSTALRSLSRSSKAHSLELRPAVASAASQAPNLNGSSGHQLQGAGAASVGSTPCYDSWPGRTLMNFSLLCHSLVQLPPASASPATWNLLAGSIAWLLRNKPMDSRCLFQVARIAVSFTARLSWEQANHEAVQAANQLLSTCPPVSAQLHGACATASAQHSAAPHDASGTTHVPWRDGPLVSMLEAIVMRHLGAMQLGSTVPAAGHPRDAKDAALRPAVGHGGAQHSQRQSRPINHQAGAAAAAAHAPDVPRWTLLEDAACAVARLAVLVRSSPITLPAAAEGEAAAATSPATPFRGASMWEEGGTPEAATLLLPVLVQMVETARPCALSPDLTCGAIRALAAAGDQAADFLDRVYQRLAGEDLGSWTTSELARLATALQAAAAAPEQPAEEARQDVAAAVLHQRSGASDRPTAQATAPQSLPLQPSATLGGVPALEPAGDISDSESGGVDGFAGSRGASAAVAHAASAAAAREVLSRRVEAIFRVRVGHPRDVRLGAAPDAEHVRRIGAPTALLRICMEHGLHRLAEYSPAAVFRLLVAVLPVVQSGGDLQPCDMTAGVECHPHNQPGTDACTSHGGDGNGCGSRTRMATDVDVTPLLSKAVRYVVRLVKHLVNEQAEHLHSQAGALAASRHGEQQRPDKVRGEQGSDIWEQVAVARQLVLLLQQSRALMLPHTVRRLDEAAEQLRSMCAQCGLQQGAAQG